MWCCIPIRLLKRGKLPKTISGCIVRIIAFLPFPLSLLSFHFHSLSEDSSAPPRQLMQTGSQCSQPASSPSRSVTPSPFLFIIFVARGLVRIARPAQTNPARADVFSPRHHLPF